MKLFNSIGTCPHKIKNLIIYSFTAIVHLAQLPQALQYNRWWRRQACR